jgi:hypothetical protein
MSRRRSHALRIALALPLVLLPAGAYLVLTVERSPAQLALAGGVAGGTFHPVAGAFELDDTDPASCEGEYRCLEQGFGNVAYREGPGIALARFEAALRADEAVAANCHRIVHWIGSASLARFEGNVAETFAAGAPSCASGYYHGILERAFAGAASKAELARLARSLCAGQGLRRRSYLDRQCRHGLGHGLMIQTGYALPTALELCGGLETGWDRRTCANGVFMENANTSFGFRSPWLDDEDPLYPCGTVSVASQGPCYLRTATRILMLHDYDYGAAAGVCASLERWARECFRGLGRDAVDAEYTPARALARCRAAGAREGDCVYGAARAAYDRWRLDDELGVLKLCEQAGADVQDDCFAAYGGALGLQHATDAARGKACARVAGPHAAICSRAAVAEVDPGGRESWG